MKPRFGALREKTMKSLWPCVDRIGVSILSVSFRATVVRGLTFSMLLLGAVGVSRGQSNQCAALPAGLVAWWAAEGNATDFTGAHSGTFPYGAAFTGGVVGQAFDFDGSYRRVSIADSPGFQLTNAMTLEAWVYPRAYGGFITFRGDNRAGLDNWTLDTYQAGYVNFTLVDEVNNSASVRAALALNQWQHVAATWDRASGALKVYINGVLGAQTNSTLVPIGILDPASEPAIGIGNHGGTFHQFPFNGLIDELGIYNRALTANEIAGIFMASSAGKCPTNVQPPATNCVGLAAGIVSWWRAENNAWDEIHTNSGTLIGGMGYAAGRVGQAFQFDGVDDGVVIPDAELLNVGPGQDFSVEAWIQAEAHTTEYGVMSILSKRVAPNLVNAQGFELALHDGKLGGQLADERQQINNFTSPGPNLIDGAYHHVAMTVARGSTNGGRFYVDGQEVMVFDPTVQPGDLSTAAPFRIGRHASDWFNGSFKGRVDEVAFYRRALASNEITSIYLAGNLGKCPGTNPPLLSCVNPPAGLVSWWRAEGDVLDSMGNAPGALLGGAGFAEGRVGQAFNVNGDQGKLVQIPDAPVLNLTNTLTFEAWINVTAHSANDAVLVVGKDAPAGVRQYMIGLVNVGSKWVFRAHLGLTSGFMVMDGTAAVLPGNWYHVALTYDGGQFRSFVNGALDASMNATGAIVTSTSPLLIGGFGTGPWNFNGRVDEVSLYDRALGQSEIQAIMNAGGAGKCSGTNPPSASCTAAPAGVISWWRGEGDAADSVALNHGTLAGDAHIGAGRIGQGFVFDGDRDGLAVGTAANLQLQDFSVETWIKRSSDSVISFNGNGNGQLFSVGAGGGGLTFYLQADNRLALGKLQVNVVTSDAMVTDTNWHHIAVTKAGSTVYFFVDGVAHAAPAYDSGGFTFAGPAYIGAWLNPSQLVDNTFWGTIDEMAVYNRALSASEVLALYNAGTFGKCMVTNPPITSCAPIPAGIISWWRASGNTQDAVSVNNGVPTSGDLISPDGFGGQAFRFNGQGDKIELNDPPSLRLTNAFTIEAWIFASNAPAGPLAQIFFRGDMRGCLDPYYLSLQRNRSIRLHISAEDLLNPCGVDLESPAIPLHEWKHVAGVFDGDAGKMRIYVDGSLAAEMNTSVRPFAELDPASNPGVAIGNHSRGFSDQGFDGMIDELAIYGRALTSNEIAAIYNAASAGKCPPQSTAPFITQQPQSLTVAANASAQFSVAATGSPAPMYQWFFAGQALSGQTNATLLLNNVLPAQAGNYFVAVTNPVGGVISSNAALSVTTMQAVVYVDGTTPGFYNDSLGTVLDGTAPQFPIPYGSGGGDPTFLPASEPDLSAATNILGNWFAPQLGLNSYWRSVAAIPSTWELNTETAIIYVIDAGPNGIADLRADLDEDNGIYVWVNGEFKFGARLPGLPSPLGQFEHTNIFLGDLPPGSNYIQILREDSGIATGYQIRLTGTQLTTNQQPPEITQAPVGQSVELGNTATFNVAAKGTPRLFYQWRFNGDNLAGQTNTSLVLSNLQLSQAGDYSVAVSNAYGSVTSSVAALTVLTFPPTITRQPTNIITIEGNTANFAVQVTGTAPLFYQWFFNTTPLIGRTSAAFSLGNAQLSDSGNYLVIVSNAFGAVTSSVATLTVNPRPPCAPVHDGLVSWWRGENDLSDAWDSNNGTATSVTYNSNGKVGRAFVSPIAQVADAPSLRMTNALTIEAWVNPTAVAGNVPRTIVAKYDSPFTGVGTQSSYYFGLTNGRVMFMLSGNGGARTNTTVFSSQTIPINQWSHLAVTYDGNAMRIYINGVMVIKQTHAGGIFAGNLNLGLGNVPPSPGFSSYSLPYSGMLDEVSLYQRALSEFEVQSIYNADLTGKCFAPPVITQQPQDQVAPLGEDVKFTATVLGSRPLRYQWQLNGTNILNATNATLILEKLKSNQAGNYSVLVTNVVGTTISTNALLALLPAPSCTETPADLISWWPGDANTFDAMGLNNIGVYSPVSYPTGKVSSAFTFNGINSRIQVTSTTSLNLTNNFSIEMWIKAVNTNTTYPNLPLLEKRDSVTGGWRGYSLSLYNGRLAFGLGAAGVTTNALYISSGPDLRDGMFHHVAATLNRTATNGGVLYVDGVPVLVFNPTAFTNSLLSSLPLYIGAPTTTFSNSYYSGLIDEPAIYSRALTAMEVLAIRQAGAAGKCKTPPSIIVQPVNQRVAENSNATFSVAASGSPLLRYQWLRNSQPISGATNLTYVTGVAATYSVRVTNLFGAALSSNAVLTINRRPVANPDTFATASNTPATFAAAKLTLNDTDLDGDSLTVTSVSISGQNGTVSLVSGMVTYTPPAGFVGNKIFTYTVADALGGTAVGTVMVTIGTGGAAPLNIIYGPTIDGSDFVVRFAGIPGLTYTIEASPDPTGPWSKVANVAAPTTDQGLGIGIFEFREPIGTNTTRFYHTLYPSY